ncbi:MAG: hypothetical protein KGR46_09460 [Verrucomicrobia bacterium]|nr:hypothetical protein [Verrucomicrobiota bacterium]
MRIDFVKEMRRFLPPATLRGTIETTAYWDYLTTVLQELGHKAIAAMGNQSND